LKEELFDICGALAQAESFLRGLGYNDEANHLAATFDQVEGRLSPDQASEGSESVASSWAASSFS
jgi:hypothetical protein